MKVTKEYDWKEVNWRQLNVGDSIRLPSFTVPEVTIDGIEKLHFERLKIRDTATVYKVTDDEAHLVFNHVLFESVMDCNNIVDWKKTQLYDYLSDIFTESMQDWLIPVSTVSLLSREDLFGENALPFFKIGKNRIAFKKDEIYPEKYWLKSKTISPYSCIVGTDGNAYYNYMLTTKVFVRPCFIVKIDEQ